MIDLLDEEEEEWPDAGAQNPEEAQQYVDKINNIFQSPLRIDTWR